MQIFEHDNRADGGEGRACEVCMKRVHAACGGGKAGAERRGWQKRDTQPFGRNTHSLYGSLFCERLFGVGFRETPLASPHCMNAVLFSLGSGFSDPLVHSLRRQPLRWRWTVDSPPATHFERLLIAGPGS